jgi:hypothetical protein
MANFDVATAADVPSPTGTDNVYLIGKKRATLANVKSFINVGQASTAQLATEQARIAALEASQGVQDTAIAARATSAALVQEVADRAAADALLLPKSDVLDSYAGGASKALSAERGKDLDTRLTAEASARTTADGLLLPKADVVNDDTTGGAAKAFSAERGKTLRTDLTAEAVSRAAGDGALSARVTMLESRDLEIGNTVRAGAFNGVLGQIEPFRLDVNNAICTPPATGTLTDGVEFGVILYGDPPGTFTCTIDFQTAGQTLQGRTGANANVTITTEYAPFTVRWNAALTTWFIVR